MKVSRWLGNPLAGVAKIGIVGFLWAGAIESEAESPNPSSAAQRSADPYCTVRGEALIYMAPSTQKMAGLLERIARAPDPKVDIFENRLRAELYRKQLVSATNELQKVGISAQIGKEMLNAGESMQALGEFEQIEKIYKQAPEEFDPRFLVQLRHFEALAYLRLGEQENCLTNHNAESCLFPISKGGVHTLQRGSRKAIEILEGQLKDRPRDFGSVWLLNIAYMTLGEYPDKVPPAWRISPETFKSDYDIKPFPDIAAGLGLDVNGYAGGTIIEDFDGDGNLDIMISDWSPRGPMHFFRNNGDGTFSDRTMEAGTVSGLVGGLNMIQGDYNNDGLPDVLVLRGAWRQAAGRHPDSLLRNDGHGHFTDVTEEAGLLAFHPNQTAVWLDFDGDGWLDIYFGYESTGDEIHPCELYRNNHDGTFTECAGAAGVAAVGFVKGVVTGDFNNDGRPDLYLSRRGQPNILFRNDGPQGTNNGWKFTDVSVQAGVTEPIVSFPTWFFDYDNDGWEDIFVSGYGTRDVGDVAADYLGLAGNGELPKLYHNNHDGTFKDVTREARLNHVLLTMGCNFGDFDNDGWLDMYLGTGDPNVATIVPNRAFRNAGGKYFQDVTTSGGFGVLQKGHAISFGDLNNDGTQDIYHLVGGAFEGDTYRSMLFENPGHGNHWVTLKLEGVKSNRIAIGARIKVIVQSREGERMICRTVGTGGSFGANPLRQEMGLGHATAIKRVEIFWPVTGRTQMVTNLDLDKFYRIREDEPATTPWNLSSFKFSKGPFKAESHQHAGLK